MLNQILILETEPPPSEPQLQLASSLFFVALISGQLGISLLILVLLILCSAMISGSEVAYFSLTGKDVGDLSGTEDPADKRVQDLLKDPEKLLATILVSNNLINIAIVLLSDLILQKTFGMIICRKAITALQGQLPKVISDIDAWARGLNFLVTVILVTAVLVLFGEVAPKIYSSVHRLKMARRMSAPLTILSKAFAPITRLLTKGSWLIERSMVQTAVVPGRRISELDKAIELTTDQQDATSIRQQDILKSLLSFNEVSTKEVMKSRLDIVALDDSIGYDELMKTVRTSGYSRLPVYREELDRIVGLLYVKDLLECLDKSDSFEWQRLVRKDVLYIPESKKIRELLTDFQEKRIHMGIVVDEYGGTAGLVTLEDVLEEVIGEIKDEFDIDQEVDYEQLSESTYVFEGKTLIKDVCRVIKMSDDIMDSYKGESDSIAGLFLEMTGRLPRKFQELHYNEFSLKAMSVSKRRIERVMITIK